MSLQSSQQNRMCMEIHCQVRHLILCDIGIADMDFKNYSPESPVPVSVAVLSFSVNFQEGYVAFLNPRAGALYAVAKILHLD